MKSGTVSTGKEWIKVLFAIQPTYQDLAWKYFGLGYALWLFAIGICQNKKVQQSYYCLSINIDNN